MRAEVHKQQKSDTKNKFSTHFLRVVQAAGI